MPYSSASVNIVAVYDKTDTSVVVGSKPIYIVDANTIPHIQIIDESE